MKNLMFLTIAFLGTLLIFSSCSEDSSLTESAEIEATESTVSTHDKRTCSHNHFMEKLLSDPSYKAAYDKRMSKHKSYVEGLIDTRAVCSSPVTIPVAVHFQGVTGDIACLTTVAEQAVAVLNADYQGQNSDITNWTGNAASSFPGISNGEACLEFVIADTNHPSGFGLTNGDLAVTRNATNGDQDNSWAGYLNIFVGDAQGSLGYAPLGGSGNGDGVMIDKAYFALSTSCGNVTSSAPFNLGRTLTHEVGHYLLLDHIWGNGCGQDDGVADTPNQQSDYSGCPNIGASSCGSTDLHMNYMDYTNDACMYMFTAGQATVSENYVASSLNNLTNNAPNVISGSNGGGGGNNGSTCTTPGSTNVQVLSNTSALITWGAQTGASNYQLQYRQSGTTPWTTNTVSLAQQTLTGLSAGTTYEFRLRANCPNGWTAFTTIESFTTTGSNGGGNNGTTCTTPGFATAQVQSNTSALISWETQTAASNYQLQYRENGTTSWTTSTTTSTQATLTGLTAGTTYNFRVRANCPNGWTGFTATSTFTTTGSTGGGGNGSGACGNPGFNEVTYLTATKAKATWEAMPQAIRYQIRYRLQGTSSWTARSSTTPQKNLTGLQLGYTYEYKIRTRCPSGWTGFTAIETFVHSNGNGGGTGGGSSNTVVFELTLDQYGSETTWELINENYQVVELGGPYSNGNSGQVITENFDLPDGCYTLYVDDSYGDGICCYYGDGSFQLLDANGTQAGYSDGNFGYFDYIDFCVTNNIVSFTGGNKDRKSQNLQPKSAHSE